MKYFNNFFKIVFFSSSFIFFSNYLQAQKLPAILKGKLIDSVSGNPLAFATVQVFEANQKKLVTGGLISESGDFSVELPFGQYYTVLEFSGHPAFTTGRFELSAQNPKYDLGTIRLHSKTTVLQNVVVQGEKSYMQFSLDKRIFNVGKDLANAGGSASDILTNIPSVSVDPEGNIKLRGSDNVRILIDGKPSGLVSIKGGGGLQQLPASLIERVEVITNPSARYEAEGNAGIINIVLKKDRQRGFNGSIEAITGYPENFGTAANFNYRKNKINFFINYGIMYRNQPGIGKLYQEVYGADTTFILQQNSKSTLKGLNQNIRGGLDYYFTEKSILTASYLFRRSDATRTADIIYNDYFYTLSKLNSFTTRRQDEKEAEPNSEYSISYKKTFTQKDHELTAAVKYIDNWESSNQTFTQHYFRADGTPDNTKSVLQKSPNDEYEKQWLLQVDYVKPLGKDGKFETGIRSSFRNMINDYLVSEKNAAGEFVPLPGLDNVFVYDENIHSAYGILGNKHKKISYQAGLRAEWTDVQTTLQKTKEINPRNYVNLFPSAHFTVDVANENALQLSYSRRVRRPFYNDLSPYMTYSDSRNFFSGNPDLDPEFSDVGEIGHIKYFDKGTISSSLYYRSTKGKIDRIRRVDSAGNSSTIPENLLSEKAWGAEFTGAWTLVKWWKLDVNLNLFHADIDGSNILKSYKTSTYSWFARQTSRFSLPDNIDIQVRTNYEAPQRTAQGKRKSLYYADLSASKDVFNGKGTITLNVMDVFNTRRFRTISTGANFYTEGNSQYRRRQINFTVNYRIRQAKQAPKKISAEEG